MLRLFAVRKCSRAFRRDAPLECGSAACEAAALVRLPIWIADWSGSCGQEKPTANPKAVARGYHHSNRVECRKTGDWERMMRWYQRLFRRARTERQLDAELRFHLEHQIADYIATGMTPEEARRRARLEFGGLEQVKEECRGVGAARFLETLIQDVRYGLRQLRRNPGFTAVAAITLALGIAAPTSIFTVVDTVLLRPLPYPDSGRIVNIFPHPCCADSTPMFTYWQENNPGFEDLTAYGDQAYAAINLNGGDRPELVEARQVSHNYFRLFGANPIVGRTFTAEEDRPGAPPVAVLSYGLWQRRFGGDAAILGKTIQLGGAPYAVVGVLSPRFKPYPATEIWIPLKADPNSTNQAHTLMVAGRLPPGRTIAEANAWMAVLAKRYVQMHPQQVGNDLRLQVTPMQEQITTGLRPTLLILLAAVGLVLLIACANVANLLLARGAGRQREIAIRSAVGGKRGRIVRQLVTESLLLAGGAGVLGVVAGSAGVRVLLALAPASAYSPAGYLPSIDQVPSFWALDPRMAGFAVVLAAATGVLFGLFPALRLSRVDLTVSLKDSGLQMGSGVEHGRSRNLLVAAEVAIAFVLLCGAMLLIRSFVDVSNQKLGIDPHNVLTMAVSLAGPGDANSQQVERLGQQSTTEIEAIPGVESAAMASALPLWGGVDMIFDIPGRRPAKGNQFTGDIEWRIVSPQYFEALRIPLLSGRLFHEQEARRTVIIHQAMAREYWPKDNTVGRTIIIGPGLGLKYREGPAEIVGVVGNVRSWTLEQPFEPTMYQMPSQVPDATMAVVNGQWPAAFIVRTRPGVAPMSVGQAVERVLLARDRLGIDKARTMEQVVQDSTANRKFTLLLMGLFAVAALVLALIGLYGVISYSVAQRIHEIGVRIALGAQRGDVHRLVLGRGLALAITGVVIGTASTLAVTRLLSSLLYGVNPRDPLTIVVVSAVLMVTAMLACYVPARRAARVDPMVALRQE
jgi:putative ABC transport system permease protein